MGFAIVIGTKSVTSRSVAQPAPIEEFAKDGTVVHPLQPTSPTIIVANSPDQGLLAVVTVSYYDMLREDCFDVEFCIAELRVQISPTAQSTSMDYRDSLYRIELPCTNGRSPSFSETDAGERNTTRMAVFSSDRRFLTCLIPHPSSTNSSVIVFQLRKSKETKSIRPPLPTYIHAPAIEPVVVVATNPRLLVRRKLTDGTSEALLNATALCDVGMCTGSSVLLVGCRDGSILVASYRPLALAGLLYQDPLGCIGVNTNNSVAIAAIDHLTEWSDLKGGTTVGRLAVVFGDGIVSVFRSHMADASDMEHGGNSGNGEALPLQLKRDMSNLSISTAAPSFGGIEIKLTETHQIIDDKIGEKESEPPFFVCVKWVAGSYLALAQRPGVESFIHVFGLYDSGRCSTISTMKVTRNQLEENTHNNFNVDATYQFDNGEHRTSVREGASRDAYVGLEYDSYSDCIAISSFLLKNDCLDCRPKKQFVCLWNWRTNAQGFLASASEPSVEPLMGATMCVSTVHFSIDQANKRRLVHFINGHMRVRKETYDISILSPPHEVACRGPRLRETCSLMLSSTTVSYPKASKTSIRDNFEIQWTESVVPKHYIESFGSPVIAAIGEKNNRSIAVASSRGWCVLDCSHTERSQTGHTALYRNNRNNHGQRPQDTSLNKLLRMGHLHPRWHMFGNETDERIIRVLAMSWWEDAVLISDNGQGIVPSVDLLVAVVEVIDGVERSGYYLSCWPSKNIEVSGQLLYSRSMTNGVANEAQWGVLLPSGFVPESLNLLVCPTVQSDELSAVSFVGSKACILLADTSHSTAYRIYQVHVVHSGAEHAPVQNQYKVLSCCSATGTIGSPAELFLASASFAFNFQNWREHADTAKDDNESVAVLGVLRTCGGGLDAFSLCSSHIIAVGQVIESADSDVDDPCESELSRFWLSDIIRDKKVAEDNTRVDFFVWVLQLASGRLVTWSVPFVRSIDQLCFMTEPMLTFAENDRNAGTNTVHSKGISLGIVCPAGNTSNWMQQSASGARGDFLAGHVPRSSFGCVIGVGQDCRNLHRSLGEEFERCSFRPDFLDHEILCPSDFILYPPASLASFYSLVKDSMSSQLYPLQDLDHFDRHIKQNMSERTLQNMLVMSLELMVLRSVEKIAAISKRRGPDLKLKRDLVRGIFVALVETARRNTTPLQFAKIFLEVGRQIEPSCFPHLFPLPPPQSASAKQSETMDDLFDKSLEQGSIRMSVSALSLLVDSETTTSMCAATFHHCLDHLDASFKYGQSYEFDVHQEECIAAGEIFRYALKLQDQGKWEDTSPNDESDDEDRVPDRGYTIMCGISNIFSRRQGTGRKIKTYTTDTSPLLVHGIADPKIFKIQAIGVPNIERLSSWQSCGDNEFKSVAGVTARYILSSVFDTDVLINHKRWKSLGALAALLISGSKNEYYFCSKAEFAGLVQSTRSNRYCALIPLEVRRSGGMTKFFLRCTLGCTQELDLSVAGHLMDILLILLGKSKDAEADIPGLLMIAIVVAHAANRITEISPPLSDESLLWTSYRDMETSSDNFTDK